MSVHEQGIFSKRNVSGQHIKQEWHLMFGNSRHCRAGNWIAGIMKMFKVLTFDPSSLTSGNLFFRNKSTSRNGNVYKSVSYSIFCRGKRNPKN